jgi:hypothetical protein
MDALAEIPATITDPAGRLAQGRWAGELGLDPVPVGPRGGRVRRWCYVGAGGIEAARDAPTLAVGAAVVDLGAVAAAFAWATVGGRTVTWEARRPLRRGAWVAPTPAGGAGLRTSRARVQLHGDGGLDLDVPVGDVRLLARVEADPDVDPVVLSTPTPRGGWNVTQKAAGNGVAGWVSVGGERHTLSSDAGGWRDWTSGRQDRRTTWRWAAGAGRDARGRRVGLNVSTGMNGRGPGEDLVWWDGRPRPLVVEQLGPADGPEGEWRVSGPDWALRFEPEGVRAADENLLLLRSRYVQPIGRFLGTLPGPGGEAVPVTLTGVTEDHLAVW